MRLFCRWRLWRRSAGGTAWAQGKTGAPEKAQTDAGKPITKDQAKELFRSVDEILGFVSSDTKLPIEHSVKRKLISRDEVNKFLKTKFDEDEGAKRLERAELVLKKFGLLDRDFDLRPFLISLLTEQIAGFYDNKTKTVNLLDWIEPEEQKPVLAHELTHALQDQTVDLRSGATPGCMGWRRTLKEDNRTSRRTSWRRRARRWPRARRWWCLWTRVCGRRARRSRMRRSWRTPEGGRPGDGQGRR